MERLDWRKGSTGRETWRSPLVAVRQGVAKAEAQSSGLGEAEGQANGKNAGMGSHHQSDEHFGLVDHGAARSSNGSILPARPATVQRQSLPCHSS